MNRSVSKDGTVRTAFDRHAGDYDRVFTGTPEAERLRKRTWAWMDRLFSEGNRILDLGSGTGEDAIHLARRGVQVHCVDVSEAMLGQVHQKAAAAGVAGQVTSEAAALDDLDITSERFDGIVSNFGVLNCVPNLTGLARLIETGLIGGGHVVLVVMGRVYPLEVLVALLRGRWSEATRRWRNPATATVAGVRFPVFYHRRGGIGDAIGVHCDCIHQEALALVSPVPGLDHLERRLPRFFGAVAPLDRALSRLPLLSSEGDHWLSVWRKHHPATRH